MPSQGVSFSILIIIIKKDNTKSKHFFLQVQIVFFFPKCKIFYELHHLLFIVDCVGDTYYIGSSGRQI